MTDRASKNTILIVEESEHDAELIATVLHHCSANIEHEVISSQDALLTALSEDPPDLVICDYQLPHLSGEEVIDLTHNHAPELPIIIVAATLSDETAADLIKKGAVDYVLKERLTRLPEAVDHALSDKHERKRRINAERDSEMHRVRLEHLFQRSMDGILVLGYHGRILDANMAAERILGCDPGELTGMRWGEFIDDADHLIPYLVDSREEDAQFRDRCVARRADGTKINLDVSLAVERLPDDTLVAYAIFRDITSELEAETALRRDKELQSLLRQVAHEFVVEDPSYKDFARPLDLVRRFLDWPLAHIYAYDSGRDAMVSTNVWSGTIGSGLVDFMNSTRNTEFASGRGVAGRALATMAVEWIDDLTMDSTYVRRQSAAAAGLRSIIAIPVVANGEPAGVVELYSTDPRSRDRSMDEALELIGHEFGRLFERKQFHRRARQRQWELETLLENAPALIVRIAPDRTVKLVNSKVATLGLDPKALVGRPLREAAESAGFPAAVVERFHAANDSVFRQGRSSQLEWNIDNGGSTTYFESSFVPELDDNGNVSSCLIITRDITQQVEAKDSLEQSQKRLEQAQRLESVGRLAGGVAHDFNNILTAINGYVFLLKDSVAPDSKIGSFVEGISTSTERARRLTHQLLLFSKRAPSETTDLDLNRIVGEMIKMLSRLISENIELRTELTSEPVVVHGDAAKLEQVIMNLVINARDAMPDGGTLTIGTQRISPHRKGREGTVDPPAAEVQPPPVGESPPDAAVLSVSDTGIGMTDDVIAKVFEPFFTTKDRERGTGLGLAVVYGIVEEHDGTVEIDSEPGKGSTFRIVLPKRGRVQQADSHLPEPLTARQYHGAHLLLVEDDDAIRSMVQDVLEAVGVEVTTAATVKEAEEVVRDRTPPGGFDIVLTDIVLPDGSGTTLPERLGLSVPFVFSSGYTEDTGELARLRREGLPFLQKPYDIDHLLATLDGQLQGERS